jgi:ORF6N domain-containing protein
MEKMRRPVIITDEQVINRIYIIRGQKVMVDSDLAELYTTTTKALKQAVRRNRSRFPEDFMFEMTPEEMLNWRSQIVTSNLAGRNKKMGLRHPPFCFTEQGVAMLSSILNTETAILVNIQVIRVFSKARQILISNKDILLQLEAIEKKISGHDENISTIFQVLKKLLDPKPVTMEKIGFKRKGEHSK